MNYTPKDNIFDKMNWEICKLSFFFFFFCFLSFALFYFYYCPLSDSYRYLLDDPKLWENQPVTLQVVGKQFDDEELIAVVDCLDQVCNG